MRDRLLVHTSTMYAAIWLRAAGATLPRARVVPESGSSPTRDPAVLYLVGTEATSLQVARAAMQRSVHAACDAPPQLAAAAAAPAAVRQCDARCSDACMAPARRLAKLRAT